MTEQVSAKADQLNEYFNYPGTPDYHKEDLFRLRILSPSYVTRSARPSEPASTNSFFRRWSRARTGAPSTS